MAVLAAGRTCYDKYTFLPFRDSLEKPVVRFHRREIIKWNPL